MSDDLIGPIFSLVSGHKKCATARTTYNVAEYRCNRILHFSLPSSLCNSSSYVSTMDGVVDKSIFEGHTTMLLKHLTSCYIN